MNCFTVSDTGIVPYISTTIVKNSRDVLMQAFLVGDEQKPDLSFRWIMLSPLFEAFFEDGYLPTAPLAIRSCEWGQSKSSFPVIRPDRGETLEDALVKICVKPMGENAAVVTKIGAGAQIKAGGLKSHLGVTYEEKLVVLKPDSSVAVQIGKLTPKEDGSGNPVLDGKTGKPEYEMTGVVCRHVIKWNGFELTRQVVGKGRRRPDRSDPFADINLLDNDLASLVVVE